MATVSVSLPSDGSTADVSDVNTPITTIVNEINGNLDNANIKTGAAIATSKLADDAGITTAKIANGSVTPAKLQSGTGSSWAWQSWTPTLSGRFNNAKWNKDCSFTQIGKTVFFKLRIIANTTTPMDGGTAEATFTLPVTSVNYEAAYPPASDMPVIGNIRILDSGTTAFLGCIEWTSTTTAKFRVYNAASTYVQPNSFTSTVPMTWTTTDEVFAFGYYEAA